MRIRLVLFAFCASLLSALNVGQGWIHMAGDLPAVIQQVSRGCLSLQTYLGGFQGPRESALFAWDDPAPGLLDLPLFAYTAAKRLLQKSVS